MSSDANNLTAAGRQRRDQILRAALEAADARRRRRGAGRIVAATAAVACVAGAASLFVASDPAPPPPVAEQRSPAPLPSPSLPVLVGHVVIDDRPVEPDVRTINDDQLIALLDEAGTPGGIAYVAGRGTVLFREAPLPDGAHFSGTGRSSFD